MLHLWPHALLLLQETETPAASGEPFGGILIPMIAVAAIFYFLVIGPERKKQKARDEMLGAMKKGDEVMTSSGMYGRVVRIQEDVITLQVADGVRLRFNRAAIQSVLEEGASESKGEAKPDAEAAADAGS